MKKILLLIALILPVLSFAKGVLIAGKYEVAKGDTIRILSAFQKKEQFTTIYKAGIRKESNKAPQNIANNIAILEEFLRTPEGEMIAIMRVSSERYSIRIDKAVKLHEVYIDDKFLVPVYAPISFTDTVQAQGVSAEVLFERANKWLLELFSNQNNVIKKSDPVTGYLLAFGYYQFDPSGIGNIGRSGPIYFTVDIYVSKGSCRYIFSNFSHQNRNRSTCSLGLITVSDDGDNQDNSCFTKAGAKNLIAQVKASIRSYVELQSRNLEAAMKATKD